MSSPTVAQPNSQTSTAETIPPASQPDTVNFPAPIVVKQYSRGVMALGISALIASLGALTITLVLASRPVPVPIVQTMPTPNVGVCVDYETVHVYDGSLITYVSSVAAPEITDGVASCPVGEYVQLKPRK